jgi:hypothetical protein
MNTLVHKSSEIDRLTVEDVKQLADALIYFGHDLPLDRTMVAALVVELLSDGSAVSTLRIRPAEDVR